MTCNNCKYSMPVPREEQPPSDGSTRVAMVLFCLVEPPSVIMADEGHALAINPRVNADRPECRNYVAKETF